MIYAILAAALLALVVCFVLLIGQQARISKTEEHLRKTLNERAGLVRQVTEAEVNAQYRASLTLKREEARMRADSIKRSKYVLTGRVAEQLAPFTEAFTYDPRDARFLGSPIDLIVFEGMTEGSIERIVLIEVKTGRSNLSGREQQVQDAVRLGEVDYEILRIEK